MKLKVLGKGSSGVKNRVAIGFVVVALTARVGLKIWNSSEAASHFTTMGSAYGITVSACKTLYVFPDYGRFYSVKILFTKSPTTPAYYYDVVTWRPDYPSPGKQTLESNVFGHSYYNFIVAAANVATNDNYHEFIVIKVDKSTQAYWASPTATYWYINAGKYGDPNQGYDWNWSQITNC